MQYMGPERVLIFFRGGKGKLLPSYPPKITTVWDTESVLRHIFTFSSSRYCIALF